MNIESRHQVTVIAFLIGTMPVTLWVYPGAIGVRLPGFAWEVKPC